MRLSVRKRVRVRGQAAQRERVRRGAGRRGGGVGVCSGGVDGGGRVCGGGGGAELDGGVVELLEERVEIVSSYSVGVLRFLRGWG